MKSVLTIKDGNEIRSMVIREDGTGYEYNRDGRRIELIDAADTFMWLVGKFGCQVIAEVNIPDNEELQMPKSSSSTDSRYTCRREEFRQQWEEYMAENAENLEVEYEAG